MSTPMMFKDAFKGIRTVLVEKILPSARFWNLMMDYDVLTSQHVDKCQVLSFVLLVLSSHLWL